MSAFETYVQTNLPFATSILASPTAGRFPRFTGVGRLEEERTPAEVLFDIAALPLAGGTMAGIINMANYAITNGGVINGSRFAFTGDPDTYVELIPNNSMALRAGDLRFLRLIHGGPFQHTLLLNPGTDEVGTDIDVEILDKDGDRLFKSVAQSGSSHLELGLADLVWPNTDGSAGHLLQTDGFTQLSFGTLDHGATTGRGDDDHTIYSLASGARDFTGTVGGITPTDDDHLTTKEYVDELVIPVDFAPTAITTFEGAETGTLSDILVLDDGNEYHVDEETGAPGFNIEIDFSGITETITRLDLHVFYDGTSAHVVNVEIQRVSDSVWINLGTIPDELDFEYMTYDITNGSLYVDAGVAHIRIRHESSGNPNHNIDLDYVSLRKIPIGGGGGITDHFQLTGRENDDHLLYLNRSGVRPMTGNLNMATLNIINVGDISLTGALKNVEDGASFLDFVAVVDANNYIQITNSKDDGSVDIAAVGSGTNPGISFTPKGGGRVTIDSLTLLGDMLAAGYAITGASRIQVDGNADEIQLEIQGNSTQNADLLLIENNAATDLFAVDNSGYAYLTRLVGMAGGVRDDNTYFRFTAGDIEMVVGGVTLWSTSASLFQFNEDEADVDFKVALLGSEFVGDAGNDQWSFGAGAIAGGFLSVTAGAGMKALMVKGAASQRILECQTSAGGMALNVDANGDVQCGGTFLSSDGTAGISTQFDVSSGTVTYKAGLLTNFSEI